MITLHVSLRPSLINIGLIKLKKTTAIAAPTVPIINAAQ